MPPIPHRIQVQEHPGSSQQDIEHEPDWTEGHDHRIGYLNRQDRRPGFTHEGDEKGEADEFEGEALRELQSLRSRVNKGDLVDFRDIITKQKVPCTIMFEHGLTCDLPGLPSPQTSRPPRRLEVSR